MMFAMARQGRHRALLCMALLGLLAGWLVIRHAAIALFSAEQPDLTLAFHPADPTALAARARARIVATDGAVDADARELIHQSLTRAPRDAEPVALAGLAASAQGDLPRAAALMRIAERFDPRSDMVRYWLLDHDVRTGNYPAALGEVGPALRLRAGTRDAVFALVAGLLDIPAGATAVKATLESAPDWRSGFFQSQARDHPLALLSLLDSLPPAPRPEDAQSEQSAVLDAAVDAGAISAAYRTWSRLVKAQGGHATGLIYDPGFHGLPGPPPFNWRLDQDAGVRIAGNALLLPIAGHEPRLLAEQYALADPGRYTVSFGVDTLQDATSPLLAARILCANDGAELANLTLSPAARAEKPRANLIVPPTCTAIRLQFVARPDDLPDPVQVRVTDVQFTRI